jgi:predicted nucleic acid-binding protein
LIVLDTTDLVHAVGDDHTLREPARAIVEAVEDGSVQATTTVEAIQALVHVRARRRGRADATAVGRAYATLLSPLLQPSEESLVAGLRLFEREEALGAFDAVLAATAMAGRADALVSADRAFAGIRGLRWVDLAGDELAGLLAEFS